jgi:hypothetical protein
MDDKQQQIGNKPRAKIIKGNQRMFLPSVSNERPITTVRSSGDRTRASGRESLYKTARRT